MVFTGTWYLVSEMWDIHIKLYYMIHVDLCRLM